jgi:parallel beta-helix repeat protein
MFRKIVAVWISLAMLFSLIVIVVDLVPFVKGNVVYVGGAGPGNYTTIQEGIDAANPGDTVFVYSGIYYENVVVNKTINLTGEDRGNTIIDGGGNKDVVYVTANWVNLTGFKIIGSGSTAWPRSAGLEINNVHNCSYFNNDFFSNTFGIVIYESTNNWIMDNNASFNEHGIIFDNSHGNYMNHNNITSNDEIGINFASSSNNNLIGNKVSSNGDYGIVLTYSLYITIINNSLTEDGIFIFGSELSQFNTHTIPDNNIINNKPVYYYKDINNLNINNIPVGELIIVNCSDIELLNLNINKTDVGIEVAYSRNVSLRNSNISRIEDYGVYLYSSSNCSLTNNNIYLNNLLNYYSIFLKDCMNNTIKGNNVTAVNGVGIFLTSSRGNLIMENNVSSNWDGISLITNSDNNILKGNNVSSNTDDGFMILSSNCTITGNTIISNKRGIRNYGNDNIVILNYISLNTVFGISVESSSLNTHIFHNTFINNVIQAQDISNNCYWDNGYPLGGNFWSDYNGIDLNSTPHQNVPPSDGIGDTPYVIDSDSQDNYPLMEQYTPKSYENYSILKQGWNLISVPLIQNIPNLATVLQMIDGYYDAVQFFNQTDPFDHWKHYRPGKSLGNDLSEINESMGFWIHITQPGETIFIYNGTQPTSNQSITLHPGWNMVGYPSLTNRTRDNALNNIVYGTDVDSIWTFNAATQAWQEIGSSDYFELGKGYWIHSKVTKVWDVPL